VIRALDHDEYASVWEGMWWAVQTVTTVGYGDVTPKSAAGRFVAAGVMLAGVALVAVVTAAVTSNFVTRAQAQLGAEDAAEEDLAVQRVDAQLQDITARLDRIEQMLRTLSKRSRSAGGR
jgi:voltage-gated potassium channel